MNKAGELNILCPLLQEKCQTALINFDNICNSKIYKNSGRKKHGDKEIHGRGFK